MLLGSISCSCCFVGDCDATNHACVVWMDLGHVDCRGLHAARARQRIVLGVAMRSMASRVEIRFHSAVHQPVWHERAPRKWISRSRWNMSWLRCARPRTSRVEREKGTRCLSELGVASVSWEGAGKTMTQYAHRQTSVKRCFLTTINSARPLLVMKDMGAVSALHDYDQNVWFGMWRGHSQIRWPVVATSCVGFTTVLKDPFAASGISQIEPCRQLVNFREPRKL